MVACLLAMYIEKQVATEISTTLSVLLLVLWHYKKVKKYPVSVKQDPALMKQYWLGYKGHWRHFKWKKETIHFNTPFLL